jgi:hypothetical protein
MRWGEQLQFTAEANPGDFIFIPPYVPHQEINASPDQVLECVLVRSDGQAVAINLDIEPVEKPETVLWIDPVHRDPAEGKSAAAEGGEIWSSEYWTKKGDVPLWMFRKRLGAPKPGEPARPVLFHRPWFVGDVADVRYQCARPGRIFCDERVRPLWV